MQINWHLYFPDYHRLKGVSNRLPRLAPITSDYASAAADLAMRLNCKTICMGHAHPLEIYDENVNGVRVVFLPRGLTTIELGGI